MGFLARLRKNVSSPSLPQNLPSTFSDVSQKARTFSIKDLWRKRVRIRRISIPLGVVLFLPITVVVLLLVLFLRHPQSPGRVLMPAGGPPSIRKINDKYDKVFVNGCLDPEIAAQNPRANAAFVVLARNKELEGIVQSIKSIERHFNRWFHYPYVFLNDGEFNSTFKEVVTNYTSGPVEFGKITPDMWGYPDWVDKDVAREGIRKQGDQAIMYGGMESYHHMCRFYSGFFYKHPLLDKYKWYWRLEPEIKYFCDITYDPFIHMERQNKTYGFTIAVKELKETVPNIFRYASAYKRMNNITSQGLWEMFVEKPKEDPKKKKELPKDDPKYKKPLPEDIMKMEPNSGELPKIDPDAMEGETYNMCHFWSNFEIARLDWFRSKEYEDFFQMMDRSGGFWMERWGDAPIHSLAAGALLGVKDIHYFRDFGYRHTTIQHCPANAPARQLPRPPFPEPPSWGHTPLGGVYSNEKGKNVWDEEKKWREEEEYWEQYDKERENGVGCRCRCDTDIVDVEGKEGSCLVDWVEVAGGWSSP